MTQIVLDAEAFKALSSDTRLQILKALDARRLTVSEMGRLLALNKATVFEHLKQLAAADLVKKEDEGRKWVYYKLTWKGRNVIHPENVQFMLLLSTAALSVGGAVALMGNLWSWWGGGVGSRSELGGEGGTPPATTAPAAPEMQNSEADSSGAAATTATGTSTASQDADLVARNGAAPEDPAAAPDAGISWDDPNLWLLAALVLLLIASAGYGYMYLRERHQERAAWRARISALPPEPGEPGVSLG